MSNEVYYIKNKLPGLAYAFTTNGIELPVLDITHPGFISSTDESSLKRMLPYVEKNAEKNANKFNNIPAFIKHYFAKHSFAMAELLQNQSSFASGISTLMMKLGPNLIGKGKRRFWDRQVTKGFGSLVMRMRIRDLSKCQADALLPLLQQSREKGLCFINIAGGAASDSINTLFLIQQKHPEVLKNRKIEINVLDIDPYGPSFAERCIIALKAPGGRLDGLEISFRHISYDWNTPQMLENLLAERNGWLQICSSEGGLFEYCSDEVIIKNLNVICNNSAGDLIIAGSLLRDINSVDAGIVAALKISTAIKPRFLGIDGLRNIIEKNKLKLVDVMENNPRYMIFSLRKEITK